MDARSRTTAAVVASIGLLASCRPELGERESLVTMPAVLAVRGEPAEAKPGETVTYTVLAATPDGPIDVPLVRWSLCATPKLLTENGAVSAACLGAGARPISEGAASASAPIPADACSLFGPEIASADLRPRDPDITGGYYQPVRVDLFAPPAEGSTTAFGLERILCRISNAGAAVAAEFGARYRPNENPTLLPIEARIDGVPAALEAIPRSARVTFRAAWPEGTAEDYVVVDIATQQLVARRETLRVSWSTTAGSFESDRTGRAENERETFTDNGWTAPDEARTTHVFAVLRDSRGGVAWATLTVTTR